MDLCLEVFFESVIFLAHQLRRNFKIYQLYQECHTLARVRSLQTSNLHDFCQKCDAKVDNRFDPKEKRVDPSYYFEPVAQRRCEGPLVKQEVWCPLPVSFSVVGYPWGPFVVRLKGNHRRLRHCFELPVLFPFLEAPIRQFTLRILRKT